MEELFYWALLLTCVAYRLQWVLRLSGHGRPPLAGGLFSLLMAALLIAWAFASLDWKTATVSLFAAVLGVCILLPSRVGSVEFKWAVLAAEWAWFLSWIAIAALYVWRWPI